MASDPSQTDTTEYVRIPVERLRELEALEANLKDTVEKHARELNNARLTLLREQDTPEKRRERNKKHYEIHKDEISKRRREARVAKKAAEAVTTNPRGSPHASDTA